MRILPVIDLKGGQVVRGVAGRRAEYRPVESSLVRGSKPADVARAFRDLLGFRELYVADLDAIAGSQPSWTIHAALRDLGLQLWVDAGVREPGLAQQLRDRGVHRLIAGLETVETPTVLGQLLREFGPQVLVFSLDLKDGQPLGKPETWQHPDPLEIARQAISLGVRRLILLDLSRVGVGSGTGTAGLCRQLRAEHPEGLELIVGGGVRGPDNLLALAEAGADAVLIASALHDGRIDARTVRQWGASSAPP